MRQTLYVQPSSFVEAEVGAATPTVLAARTEFQSDETPVLARQKMHDYTVEVRRGRQALWILVKWPDDTAGVAFRAAGALGSELGEVVTAEHDDVREFHCQTAVGHLRCRLEVPEGEVPLLHWTTWLAPSEDVSVPPGPRDLYPVGADHDPLATRGILHASQSGPHAALAYLTLTKPRAGSVLYIQNATSLNDYCDLTHTSPADTVGGTWPELGFALPEAKDRPLPGGREVVISDAYVAFTATVPENERQAAREFLDLYAAIYLSLPLEETEYRDWLGRLDETLRDLGESDEVARTVNGQRYLTAYVGDFDKPPESMVQLAVLLPLTDYTDWSGRRIPLVDQLKAGLPTFWDERIGAMGRWLQGVEMPSKEEHMGRDIMDSWYMHHTLLNLSRLAADGAEEAERLFRGSIDYAIRVAQHFDYRWPVLFNVDTLEAIKAEKEPGEGGESDVGALYAQVMLQAVRLTGDGRYVEEAERAAEKLDGLGFRLAYQFNNTSFGAGALLRLWRETGKELYRELSEVCLANVLHHVWLWQCNYGHARHYRTFFALPPLTDCDYIAPYEEAEALAAFYEYLAVAADDVRPSVRLMLAEYAKYVIDRCWFYYPAYLPREALAEEQKDGYLNATLAVPVEDLYDGWTKAGAVGQEVYGGAVPFVLVTRVYHPVPAAPFILFCEYPVADADPPEDSRQPPAPKGRFSFRLMGDGRRSAKIRLIPLGASPLPTIKLSTDRDPEGTLTSAITPEGHLQYEVPGDRRVQVEWESLHQSKPEPQPEPQQRKRSGGRKKKTQG